MFRRRRRNDEAADDPVNDPTDDPTGDPTGEAIGAQQQQAAPAVVAGPAEPPPRPHGPWDVADVTDEIERFDLGGIRLHVPDGGEVQLEMAPDGSVLPTILVEQSAVQVSAFAAPRRSGIWAEVRAEIAEALTSSGGAAEEADGPFGTELRAHVPIQTEDGQFLLQPARFVGVDGPRWFLRGLITGAAAVEPAAAATIEDAFRGTVVVRGGDAMAPRDPLPVQVPREVLEAAGVPEDERPGIDPFERGPEITEVR